MVFAASKHAVLTLRSGFHLIYKFNGLKSHLIQRDCHLNINGAKKRLRQAVVIKVFLYKTKFLEYKSFNKNVPVNLFFFSIYDENLNFLQLFHTMPLLESWVL